MTLSEAQEALRLARDKARKANGDVARLKLLVESLGGSAGPSHPATLERNKEIYKRWSDGESFSALAAQYKISDTRVRDICQRIDWALQIQSGKKFALYKDLLPHKKENPPKRTSVVERTADYRTALSTAFFLSRRARSTVHSYKSGKGR